VIGKKDERRLTAAFYETGAMKYGQEDEELSRK
jgi:hypothetical protein